MLLCGIDFETTGLDIPNERVLEVGLVLWDTEYETLTQSASLLIEDWAPGETNSAFLQRHPNRNQIELLTHITPKILEHSHIAKDTAKRMIQDFITMADYVVAHNATFEKQVLQHHFGEYLVKMKPWLDTMTDIPYPETQTNKQLTYLAADHGFLNPFPHRALPDVLTMFKILSEYSIESIISYANMPTIWLRADVTIQEKDLAKGLGYRWDPEARQWKKSIKQDQQERETQKAAEKGFRVYRVEHYDQAQFAGMS